MLLLLIVGASFAFYAFYLWGLSRLLARTGFPQTYVAWVVILDVVLVAMRMQPWLWIAPLHPPIPKSAFCALMLLAFMNWPSASVEKPTLD